MKNQDTKIQLALNEKGGGGVWIFIYSSSTRRISFEIRCYTGVNFKRSSSNRTRICDYDPPSLINGLVLPLEKSDRQCSKAFSEMRLYLSPKRNLALLRVELRFWYIWVTPSGMKVVGCMYTCLANHYTVSLFVIQQIAISFEIRISKWCSGADRGLSFGGSGKVQDNCFPTKYHG